MEHSVCVCNCQCHLPVTATLCLAASITALLTVVPAVENVLVSWWLLVQMCMYIRMYVCVYVSMYVCMYVCMYVSICCGTFQLHFTVACASVRSSCTSWLTWIWLKMSQWSTLISLLTERWVTISVYVVYGSCEVYVVTLMWFLQRIVSVDN